MFGAGVSFFISVHLRNSDLPPLQHLQPRGRGVQFGLGASNWVDTPFLQATTHEHERRTPSALWGRSRFKPIPRVKTLGWVLLPLRGRNPCSREPL